MPSATAATRILRKSLQAALLAAICLAASFPLQAKEPWRDLPWHLVDHYYNFGDVGAFQSLRIEIDVKGNPAAGDFLYVSPFWGKIGPSGFYFGLQTDIHDSRSGTYNGKGVIFSRWGNTSTGDARPAQNGWSVGMTHEKSGEGDFAGVRIPFNWTEGNYTFRLLRRAAEGEACWVDLEIFDRQSAKRTDGGGLRFPDCASFYRGPASFIEIYKMPKGASWPGNYTAPKIEVRFHTPIVNDIHRPRESTSRVPPGVPPFARMTKDSDGVTAVISSD
jgi:hypothetical protein